jgi:serine/threonine-protein kinase RsbW
LKASKSHSINVSSSTEHLRDVRNFIQKFIQQFDVNKNDLDEIILAVDEAYTNIIKHAYNNDPNHNVKIELGTSTDTLWVRLSDTGFHFNADKYQTPDLLKRIKNKQRGGMGVYLINKLMDSVEYSSAGKTNTILMRKRI